MDIIIILVGNRTETAVKVQEILTSYGDIIRTRLGLNREMATGDGGTGLIFLELCGEEQKIKDLCKALNEIEHIKAECIRMELPNSCAG